jgi:dGTPase
LEHEKAEVVVNALFKFWVENPDELPDSYVEEIPTEGLPRVIADYIAGMTDSYILLQYAEVKRHPRLFRV